MIVLIMTMMTIMTMAIAIPVTFVVILIVQFSLFQPSPIALCARSLALRLGHSLLLFFLFLLPLLLSRDLLLLLLFLSLALLLHSFFQTLQIGRVDGHGERHLLLEGQGGVFVQIAALREELLQRFGVGRGGHRGRFPFAGNVIKRFDSGNKRRTRVWWEVRFREGLFLFREPVQDRGQLLPPPGEPLGVLVPGLGKQKVETDVTADWPPVNFTP